MSCQNHENLVFFKIQRQNNENHENLIITHHIYENHEILRIQLQNQETR